MALKFTVASLDEVPEAVRSLYTENDGKFTLAVEGAVSSDRLAEFRTNNRDLLKQVKELTEKYGDIDPDKYQELAAEAAKLREKSLVDAGKIDELVTERTAKMREDAEKQLKAVAGERDTFKKQIESLVIDGALRDAATKAGVAPTAIDDILLRGRNAFRLVDGKAVAMDGDKPLYGKDSEPLGVSEWVGGLADSAPHLFPASQGGGARGSASGNAKTITRAQFSALDPAEQAAAAMSKDVTIVE